MSLRWCFMQALKRVEPNKVRTTITRGARCYPRYPTRPLGSTTAISITNNHPTSSDSTMSSPAPRRTQRNSQSATPRRSVRSSQAPQSSPFASSADDQLQFEASQAAQQDSARATPRASRLQHNIAVSSPLFFRSSPVVGSGVGNGADVSSPVRQSSNTTDGDRTPRASERNIGGQQQACAKRTEHLSDRTPLSARFITNSLCVKLES